MELTTGRKANYGDEHTNLADWAWRYIEEGNHIADALDEEIKEACYVDEMSNVFKLGIICTSKLPSSRPSMNEVVEILLRSNCLHFYREKPNGSEYDADPLLKNSSREQWLRNADATLAYQV